MAVSKSKSKTATAKKAGRPKTKPFRQDTETGKIVSPARVASDKKGTMVQTVNQDNDGVRSDKGTKRTPKPVAPEQEVKDASQAQEAPETVSEAQGQTAANPSQAETSPTFDTDYPAPPTDTSSLTNTETEDAAKTETLPCLISRPNKGKDYTCLDEVKEAVDHPERFTTPQLTEILSDNNLCANCKKNSEVIED